VTDRELVMRLQKEWEAASAGGSKDSNAEGLRLVWALVHSRSTPDISRGLQLAEALVDRPDMDDTFSRELIYLRAVGKYRSKKYLEAKKQLDELLKIAPDSHQAMCLKKEVDDAIIKDGLIGVGVVGGVVGVAALIIGGLLAGGSRR